MFRSNSDFDSEQLYRHRNMEWWFNRQSSDDPSFDIQYDLYSYLYSRYLYRYSRSDSNGNA